MSPHYPTGTEAAHRGLPRDSNPFPANDARADQWLYEWFAVHCERAQEEGAAARAAGQRQSDCPYCHMRDGPIYGAWVDGWENYFPHPPLEGAPQPWWSQLCSSASRKGAEARAAGQPRTACPFVAQSADDDSMDLVRAWCFGWDMVPVLSEGNLVAGTDSADVPGRVSTGTTS